MKSFFKKLSLVLAAAMVITMLPLQSAKAVTKVNLGIDATKAAAGETIELEVGATQKIGFYGVTNYNTAGAKTKVWKSDNTSVATVTNAFITAVAPGTANISFSCTNNGIDYTGTVKVVVKAAGSVPQTQGNVSAKQTTWQTVVVTFADEEAAKAAKDGVKVERVKTSSKGTFYLNVSVKPVVKDNTLVIEPLSDKVTYRITVPGVKKPFEITMSVGAPDFVDISYDTVYMSADTKTDITGKSLSNPLVTPDVKVYDANGTVVQTDPKGFKFTTDPTSNIGKPVFNSSKGTIRFNKLESTCYVKVVYSYKDANNKTITLPPAETTVSPVQYVAPNLQGFVEKITLVEKDAKANEIVYPSDYNYKAEIAVDQELALAFYFETPEGKKYVPDIVKSTVINDKNKDTMLNCKANGAAYSYYVVKDDPSATNISFKENSNGTVYIKGWNEGEETICIYERAKAGKEDIYSDKLVGILNIEVSEEAKVVSLGLSETALNGFINTQIADDQVGTIEYKLEDQYGKAIKALLEVKASDGKTLNGITIEGNGTEKGKIKVNYNQFGKSVEGRELEISVKNQKDEFKDYITVATDEIDNRNGRLGYALVVNSKTVKNVDFKDATAVATGLQLTIDVARTYDDNKYDLAADFHMIGDADTTTAIPSQKDALVIVITDEDGNTVAKNINGVAFIEASRLGDDATVAAANNYKLDLFKNGATEVGAHSLFKGNYTVTLYKTTDTKAGAFELLDAVDIAITDGVEKLQQTNNTYVLERDDKKVKVTSTKSWADNRTSSNTGATLVAEIVKELYTWIDRDSDGEVDASGEIVQIKDLQNVQIVEPKFVEGADNKKEIYIKHVTVRFKLDSNASEPGLAPIIEQTIVINRKFNY